jgi:hypothetical protein
VRELFVYYRVRDDRAGAALVAVQAMQDAMRRRHPALRTRLLRRPPTDPGPQTWMEIYAMDERVAPDGVDASLQEEIELHAGALLAACIDGDRHVEVFERLSPTPP